MCRVIPQQSGVDVETLVMVDVHRFLATVDLPGAPFSSKSQEFRSAGHRLCREGEAHIDGRQRGRWQGRYVVIGQLMNFNLRCRWPTHERSGVMENGALADVTPVGADNARDVEHHTIPVLDSTPITIIIHPNYTIHCTKKRPM